VKTWILSGRSCFGGKGRKGVRPYNIFLNSEGIPGKMQSFPARRTTGWLLTVRVIDRRQSEKNGKYHPDVVSDEKNLGMFREECHSMSSNHLFGVWSESGSIQLTHAVDSLLVVDKSLTEGVCKRRVCYVFIRAQHRRVTKA
jgi:hypothetical protein